jgi:flap endonuclease-1
LGTQIKDLVDFKEVDLEHLQGKVIAVDAMNTLYQFLSIIRQRDGTPLKDSNGRVTSHLSGLFYRTSNLLELGIRPFFVFDGEPPELKSKTLESRRQIKAEAEKARKEALERGDEKEAFKYAQRSSRLSDEMVGQSKTLLSAMGVPWIQAPGEGEAQATLMAKKGDAWAVGSQDFDCLLYGAPILIRNMTITGKRKLPGKDEYKEVLPEIVELSKFKEEYDIDQRELIAIGVLVGTDYNDGIKGIGPKRALKIVKENGNLEEISDLEVYDDFEVDPLEVERIFLDPKVLEDYDDITWSEPSVEKVKDFLCEKHDFSESRVESGIEKLEKGVKKRAQKSLENWAQ